MGLSDAIPGFKSYMDADVSVEVSVGDAAEAAANEAEAADEAAGIEETNGDIQEDAAEAEMIFRKFDEYRDMIAHVAKFGISRDWFAWVNRDGHLASSLRLNVPAMESIDTVGNPNDALAIACMESVGEVVSKVWEFIKRVCARIKKFIVDLFNRIFRSSEAAEKKLDTIEKAVKEGEEKPDPEPVETYDYSKIEVSYNKAKAVSGELENLLKKVTDAKDRLRARDWDKAITVSEEINKSIENIRKINEATGKNLSSLVTERINKQGGVLSRLSQYASAWHQKNSMIKDLGTKYKQMEAVFSEIEKMANDAAKEKISGIARNVHDASAKGDEIRAIRGSVEAMQVNKKTEAFQKVTQSAQKAVKEFSQALTFFGALRQKALACMGRMTTGFVSTKKTTVHSTN